MAGAGAEVLLRVKGLSAGYGPRGRDGKPAVTILEDIDLELKRGQAIGVIGESGSGKTTLARVVAGLLPPSIGTMEFDGRALPPALGAAQPRRPAPHPDRLPVGRHGAQPVADDRGASWRGRCSSTAG